MRLALSGAIAAAAVSAASFPPTPEGITLIDSEKFPGYSISYKETTICETTPGVKSYSGYVNIPADSSSNRNYDSHIFFWFFSARNSPSTAPLALWLQGGPGVPSIQAAVGENGPCTVLSDSKTTALNTWSWNDKANILYIDQPLQVGFSYDYLQNGTIDEISTPFAYTPANFSNGVPDTNATFLTGTFASGKLYNAPNTTVAAAPVIWDFLQTWIQEFPEYKAPGDTFSIWGESYAGHYAPVYADYFETQSERIKNGTLGGGAVELHVNTVGLVNACVDIDVQQRYYAEYAYNNTYDLQMINKTQYETAIAAVSTCQNLTAACRALVEEKDPKGLGNQADVNKACLGAYSYCFTNIHDSFAGSLDLYDIAAPAAPLVFPYVWAAGYLNDAETQKDLGVPINFTGQSVPIAYGFQVTGDFVRDDGRAILTSLSNRGVKIALVYGDRDFQCNWLGGEALSLALTSDTAEQFKNAGYADIETNASYSGGFVRQHNGLSFARVFQAGHAVPSYQPETAYQIFNRVISDRDVATGKISTKSGYSSSGPSSAFTKSVLPDPPGPAQCYIWDVLQTCTSEQEQSLRDGSAIIKDYILVEYES